jgi:hypothetical protein
LGEASRREQGTDGQASADRRGLAARLSTSALLAALAPLGGLDSIESVRDAVRALRESILAGRLDAPAADPASSEADPPLPRGDVVLAELDQVAGSRTLERARHYLRRLQTGLAAPRRSDLNDLNLARWKEHDEVLTDSLWLFDRRDSAGAHVGSYWGNFVPQIPRQMMLRYTRRGDWVVDGFAGSGTTLIECRRLGRNGLGIELSGATVTSARSLIEGEANPAGVTSDVVVGDSRRLDVGAELSCRGAERAQLPCSTRRTTT